MDSPVYDLPPADAEPNFFDQHRAYASTSPSPSLPDDSHQLQIVQERDLYRVEGGTLYFDPHPGQVEALRSTRPIVLVCAGHQSGKCLGLFAILTKGSGEQIFVKDAVPGDYILSLDPRSLKIVPARVVASQSNGVKPTVRLTTATGRTNLVSTNHPFLTPSGWVEAQDIAKGTRIAVPRVVRHGFHPNLEGGTYSVSLPGAMCAPQPPAYSEKWLKLLGYLVADGMLNGGTPGFCDTDEEVLDDVRRSLPEGYELRGGERNQWRITDGSRHKNSVMAFVRECGIDCLSRDKRLPPWVFTIDLPSIAIVLRSMFSCDGWVDTKGVGYCSASETLARQVQHLLLRFGIVSRLRYRRAKCQTGEFDSWDLQVSSLPFLEVFAEHIGFVGHSAQKLTDLIAEKHRRRSELAREFDSKDTIPHFPAEECLRQIKKTRIGKANTYEGVERRRYELYRRFRRLPMERAGAQLLADEFGVAPELAYSDIYWDTVTSITPAPTQEVWDIEVEGTHTLIADDIISHNTSLAPVWLMTRMQAYGPGDYAVVGATFPLMDTKLLPEFKNFWETTLRAGTYAPSKRALRLSPNGERLVYGHKQRIPTNIHFRSAENPNSLESFTAKAIVVDEAGQDGFPLASWEAIERRVRVARGRGQGQIYIGTTPYAFGGWFYFDLYQPAMDERNGRPTERSRDIHMINFASTMNPIFPQSEYDKAQRTLPNWKFQMMFNGVYVRPAGLIYSDFRDTSVRNGGHLLPPSLSLLSSASHPSLLSSRDIDLEDPRSPNFRITWDHPRATGVDFGSVNTAIVTAALPPAALAAFNLDPRNNLPIIVIYRTHRLSGYSSQESGRFMSKQAEGEPRHRAWGGAPSEQDQRAACAEGGFRVDEPPIRDVEAGIDRLTALIRADRLYVCEDQRGWLEEVLSYRRKLDDLHEPTEEIAKKKDFHYMDATRYLAAGLAHPRRATQVGARLAAAFGRF